MNQHYGAIDIYSADLFITTIIHVDQFSISCCCGAG